MNFDLTLKSYKYSHDIISLFHSKYLIKGLPFIVMPSNPFTYNAYQNFFFFYYEF